MLFMLIGFFCFELLPGTLLGLFSHDPDVFSIGIPAFRIIGLSFLPAVVSLLSPVFFQAIGNARISALLSLIRQLGCLIPIFFALSKIGLSYTWIAFPASEIITGVIGVSLYLRQVRQWAGGVDFPVWQLLAVALGVLILASIVLMIVLAVLLPIIEINQLVK